MIDPRSLSLLWPSMLWLLLAVPLLGVFYLRMMRRRSASFTEARSTTWPLPAR